jgi:hypothetical protein
MKRSLPRLVALLILIAIATVAQAQAPDKIHRVGLLAGGARLPTIYELASLVRADEVIE